MHAPLGSTGVWRTMRARRAWRGTTMPAATWRWRSPSANLALLARTWTSREALGVPYAPRIPTNQSLASPNAVAVTRMVPWLRRALVPLVAPSAFVGRTITLLR
eukprot:Rmarinus@m.1946